MQLGLYTNSHQSFRDKCSLEISMEIGTAILHLTTLNNPALRPTVKFPKNKNQINCCRGGSRRGVEAARPTKISEKLNEVLNE